MNPFFRKLFYPFLLPNGLLFAAVVFSLAQKQLPEAASPFIEVFPYAVLAGGLLLGWRFNRTRLVFVLLLLLLADLSIFFFADDVGVKILFQLIAVLLPVNLLVVSCFKERGFLHPKGIVWLLSLFAGLLIAAWFAHDHRITLQSSLDYSLLPEWQDYALNISQPVLLVNTLVLSWFVLRCCRTTSVFEVSFFWAQLLLMVVFLGFAEQPFRLCLASAGLIFVLGIMESSHSLAYRDELTGLHGRRALEEALAKLGNIYTLAMLDIDHFKKFNDTHGHDVGDQVLKMVAGRLARVAGGGKVFRYGGEEFSVVFPRKSVQEAQPFLEAIRGSVEEACFIQRGKDRPKKKPKNKPRGKKNNQALRVTISIGAAERTEELNSPNKVIKAADEALYRAKKAGRNRLSF